ncbi:uncharacterized protein LOC131243387 [Magnolia sinica]|uniref:uncharacterized protein LOC131243387 n=1 Tax=Magnolia sinica TaxID=86752 RepID=UPI0026588F3D|nr:uncharacterized protein LOC131243387 [Magnolia sinica]
MAAATATAAALMMAHHHHHHLLRPAFPFLPKLLHHSSSFLLTLPTSFPRRFFCTRSSLTHPHISSSVVDDFQVEAEYEDADPEQPQPQEEETTAAAAAAITDSIRRTIVVPVAASSSSSLPLPNLSIKEKKELASYAHSLGKKLKCQQVGKSGITPSVAAAFVENLESNELLKLKVHNSCPGELADVVKQLEESTGSVAVGQIGRAVILYRPSLTKLKAAEKKKQHVQRVRKGFPLKTDKPKVQVMRSSGQGRR